MHSTHMLLMHEWNSSASTPETILICGTVMPACLSALNRPDSFTIEGNVFLLTVPELSTSLTSAMIPL